MNKEPFFIWDREYYSRRERLFIVGMLIPGFIIGCIFVVLGITTRSEMLLQLAVVAFGGSWMVRLILFPLITRKWLRAKEVATESEDKKTYR